MKVEFLKNAGCLVAVAIAVSSCGGSGGGSSAPEEREPEQQEIVEEYPKVSLSEIRVGSVPSHQRQEYTEYQEQTAEDRSPFGQVYVASYTESGSERAAYLHVDGDGGVSAYTEVLREDSGQVCYRRPVGDEPNTLLDDGVFRSEQADASDEPDYEFPVENLKRGYTMTVAASGFRGVGEYASEIDPTYVEWTNIENPGEYDIHVVLEQDDFGYLDSVSVSGDLFADTSGAMVDHYVNIDETPARFLVELERSDINPKVFGEQRCSSSYTVAHEFNRGYQLDNHEGEPSYSLVLSYDVAEEEFSSLGPGSDEGIYVYNLKLVEDEEATGTSGAAGSEGQVPVCYDVHSDVVFRYNAWDDIYYAFSQHAADEQGSRVVGTFDLNAESLPVRWYYFQRDEESGHYVSYGEGEGNYLVNDPRYFPERDYNEGIKKFTVSLRDRDALLGDEYKQLLDQRCSGVSG